MLLTPCALQSLNGIVKTLRRIIWATFNDNYSTRIIFYFSPTNDCDEMNITFFERLCSFDRHIRKNNVAVISRDMNAWIGKDENNKFCFQSLQNRNGEYLTDFSFYGGFFLPKHYIQMRVGKLYIISK